MKSQTAWVGSAPLPRCRRMELTSALSASGRSKETVLLAGCESVRKRAALRPPWYRRPCVSTAAVQPLRLSRDPVNRSYTSRGKVALR
eukprot:672595-Rhodomonas_salina.1